MTQELVDNHGWIDVNERLPEVEDDDDPWKCHKAVLIYRTFKHYQSQIGTGIFTSYRSDQRWDVDDKFETYDGEVTHWMPLPEPPVENKVEI